jgi:hypothetical protein
MFHIIRAGLAARGRAGARASDHRFCKRPDFE